MAICGGILAKSCYSWAANLDRNASAARREPGMGSFAISVARRVAALVEDLNRFYRSEPALYQQDFSRDGFQGMDCNYAEKVW